MTPRAGQPIRSPGRMHRRADPRALDRTICYSTSRQPAKPIIDASGTRLPGCDINIRALSLVIQHGPERAKEGAHHQLNPATGASYAMIVRTLAADNAELDKCDRVTVDSIRTHTTKHFPVQSVAKATYREILERRARENRVDFVEGVATALLPVTFFEVVMNKAFRALVDDRTEVSVEIGLRTRREASVRPRRA